MFGLQKPNEWFDVMNDRVDDYKAGITRNEDEINKINWKIYKVLAKQAIMFTTLWIFEMTGVLGII